MTQISNKADFATGLTLTAVGSFVAYSSILGLELGTMARLGPGFFPMIVGIVLSILGIVITISSLAPNSHDINSPNHSLGPIFPVVGSIVLFGTLLPFLGVLPATFALVACVLIIGTNVKLITALVVSVALCCVAAAMVKSLALPLTLVGS